jgi:hypothetical protein
MLSNATEMSSNATGMLSTDWYHLILSDCPIMLEFSQSRVLNNESAESNFILNL